MIDKIIFTKEEKSFKFPQMEFEMPIGYKLYTPDTQEILSDKPTVIDFAVKVYTERPATFIFTSAIHSIDFKIIDPIQMIAPNITTSLKLSVINPIPGENPWTIAEGNLIASLLVVETYAVNLFEVSNKVFKQHG